MITMDDFTQTLIHYKIAIVLLVLIIIFAFEKIKPIVQSKAQRFRIRNNLGLWFINSVLSLLIILPLAQLGSQNALGWRPQNFPFEAELVINLLLLDFLIYWWHRANHEIKFLWKFHEVHHLDRFLDLTTSIRFHFGEVLLSSGFRLIAIILFDISFSSIVIFEMLVLISSGFHHSNIKISEKWDDWISTLIVTPSIHGTHHHAIQKDTDSNYSTILSCWDVIFRPRNRKRRTANSAIGVENKSDAGVFGLLIRPFIKEK